MSSFGKVAFTFLVCMLGGFAPGSGASPLLQKSTANAPIPMGEIDQAIALSTKYLLDACGTDGKFAYLIDPSAHDPAPSDYDVVRHAGAMYALAMSNRLHPDPRLVGALVRSGKFLQENYVRPDPMRVPPRWDAIWNGPIGQHGSTVALLGATGLGVVAFSDLLEVQPKAVPLDKMQALGRFILFLETRDGSFSHFSYFAIGHGKFGPGQSLYFPGEAALALIHLHEVDPAGHWLSAGERALDYLARSRRGLTEVPADNWALIATAKLLALPEVAKNTRLRTTLVAHAVQVCESILRDQIPEVPASPLSGGFDLTGRTTPTSTRLEGLQAALEFLPPEQKDLRIQIELAVNRAARFLLESQIRSGPCAGGIPRGVVDAPRASEIRIDYVQHFLSAMIRYQKRAQDSTMSR